MRHAKLRERHLKRKIKQEDYKEVDGKKVESEEVKNEEVKNIDLWKRLLEAKKPHDVEFIWVKGHNGDEMNERCDRLATAAADAFKG